MRGRGAAAILRWTIGLILLTTSAGKLLDVRGFGRVLETYGVFSPAVLAAVAYAVPLAELAVSFWLLSGLALAGAALASLILHALYTIWSAANLLRGVRVGNCGCFGVFFPQPLTWFTVAEDLVLMSLSGLLLQAATAGSRRR